MSESTLRTVVLVSLVTSVAAFLVTVSLAVMALMSPVTVAAPRTFPGHPGDAGSSSAIDLGRVLPRTTAPAPAPLVTLPWGGAK